MTTVLESYIADSMDESMQPYIESDEYLNQRAAINQKLICFRNGLTETQQKDFNHLLNMMNDAHAEFAAKAYVFGAVNGIALREQFVKL